MGRRSRIVLANLAAAFAANAAPAQTPPDFAPNPNVGWVAMSGEFIAPQTGLGPVRRHPDYRRVSNDDLRATGAQPTFPMGDPGSPILLPWAAEAIEKHNDLVRSGKPAFPRQASCWPVGVPAFLLYPVQPVYFTQTPKMVTMIWQADHQVRRIYLTGRHSENVKPSWFGESIGHYEGDTLVVDTIGIDIRTVIDGFQTPHTEQLHVVERFRLTDGGKTLEAGVHVEDPGAFTAPWNAMQRYRRVEPDLAKNPDPFNPLSSTTIEGPMIESSCAENPNSLMGMAAYPVPQDDRPDF